MNIKMARSRVRHYLWRIFGGVIEGVKLGDEVFADGTRHLLIKRPGLDRYASVGRPRGDNAEQLLAMVKKALEDDLAMVPPHEIIKRLMGGAYDVEP